MPEVAFGERLRCEWERPGQFLDSGMRLARTGMNVGIIFGSTMKTAISIDDGLLQEADKTAQSMGLSRSRLFAVAVGEFLKRHREEQMLHRLNEVYSDGLEAQDDRLLKSIKGTVRGTLKERW